MFKYIKSLFNYHEHNKQLLIIVLLSFLMAFSLARTYSLIFSSYSIYIKGYHIHHFYLGMLTLSVGGLLGILSVRTRLQQVAALLIGAGIGLFADEIGLLLNCTSMNRICTYAFPDTFDIIFAITLALISVMVLTDILDRRSAKNKLEMESIEKQKDLID